MANDCVTSSIVVTTADPLIVTGTPPSCGVDRNVDPQCQDPQYAADNPLTCPNSSPLLSIEIVPATGSIEISSSYGYQAIANYESGAQKNVTEDSDWSTDNAAIASMLSPGLITGTGLGTTTVKAVFKGLSAYAQLTVTGQCQMDSLDVALVLQVSATMETCDTDVCAPGMSRLDKAKRAAKSLLANLTSDDQCAVVQFGGIITTNANGTLTKVKNAKIIQPLTLDAQVAANGVDLCAVNEPCQTFTPTTATMNCASGIGGGLELAVQELNSVRARGGNVLKVIVLCADGVENICDPDPEVIAAAAKGQNILIIVVAIDVPDVPFFDCAAAQQGSHAFLLSLASNGLAYFVESNDLGDILTRVPNLICENGYGYGGYSYVVPPDHHYFDQLDYTGFINWVVEGTVDLIGRDLFILWPPSTERGAYVDMMGTQNNGIPGALLSRIYFDLPPGNYRVSIEVSGDHRINRDSGDRNLKIRLSLPGFIGGFPSGTPGDIWSQVIEIPYYLMPFSLYQFDFNIPTFSNGSLKIEQWDFPTTNFPHTVGTPIDNVGFYNLDTAETLLFDNFNNENPAP